MIVKISPLIDHKKCKLGIWNSFHGQKRSISKEFLHEQKESTLIEKLFSLVSQNQAVLCLKRISFFVHFSMLYTVEAIGASNQLFQIVTKIWRWAYLAARWPTQLIIDFFPKKLFWYWLWTSSHDLCAPLFLTFILRSLRIVGTFYENWVRQIFPMEMNKFLLISLKELHGKFKWFFRHIRIRIIETSFFKLVFWMKFCITLKVIKAPESWIILDLWSINDMA